MRCGKETLQTRAGIALPAANPASRAQRAVHYARVSLCMQILSPWWPGAAAPSMRRARPAMPSAGTGTATRRRSAGRVSPRRMPMSPRWRPSPPAPRARRSASRPRPRTGPARPAETATAGAGTTGWRGIHVAGMSMLSSGDSGGCAGFRADAGRHGRRGGEHQCCLDQRHSCLGRGTDHRQAQCTGQRIAELVQAVRQQRHRTAASGCQQHRERGRVDGRQLPRPPALARRHRRHVERLAAGTSSAAAFGHGFLSVVACRRQPAALALAMYSRTCCSSTGIGTEPWLSTASWKARMSNLGPSACSASARRRWMVNSPSM